jgi:hypothetical protein
VQKSIPMIPNGILGIGSQEEFDVEALHERLRTMSDAELLRSGKAARFMHGPGANFEKPPRECLLFSEGGKNGVEAEE